MQAIRTFIEQIGGRRLAMMGGIAVALLAALAYLSFRAGDPEMGYLFTELDPSAAQAIAEKLQADNVPHRLSADGTAVLAPQERLAELRMSMAADRLGGKVGYAVLDEEEPFGVSASRAKLNETRAIEGELARSIQSLQDVSTARVHIVMPERAVFSAQARRATAAVTVRTRGRLPAESVQAIRYLVASSVPELSAESVSIIDQSGALLARAGESGTAGASDADERQQSVEAKLRDQIETMLGAVVGLGKVRAEVAAEIDRDQTREEASEVDPDKQAIAHQVTVESNDQSDETQAGPQAASVSEQLPEAQGQDAAPGDSSKSARSENSEDTTYENSRTSKVTVRVPGRVTRLTVAVMVDGGENGLPKEEIQRLQRLVENAVGFNAERGDSVIVEAVPFAPQEVEGTVESLLNRLPLDQIFSVLKLLIIAAVALIATRLLRPTAPPATAGGPAMEFGGELTPERREAGDGEDGGEPSSAELLDQEIALAEVDGKIKLSAIKRIGDTVKTSPMEATSVIRQWMSQ